MTEQEQPSTAETTTTAPGYVAQLVLYRTDDKGILWPHSATKFEADLTTAEAEELVHAYPWVTTEAGASA
jgi:hypothetical protein